MLGIVLWVFSWVRYLVLGVLVILNLVGEFRGLSEILGDYKGVFVILEVWDSGAVGCGSLGCRVLGIKGDLL